MDLYDSKPLFGELLIESRVALFTCKKCHSPAFPRSAEKTPIAGVCSTGGTAEVADVASIANGADWGSSGEHADKGTALETLQVSVAASSLSKTSPYQDEALGVPDHLIGCL